MSAVTRGFWQSWQGEVIYVHGLARDDAGATLVVFADVLTLTQAERGMPFDFRATTQEEFRRWVKREPDGATNTRLPPSTDGETAWLRRMGFVPVWTKLTDPASLQLTPRLT